MIRWHEWRQLLCEYFLGNKDCVEFLPLSAPQMCLFEKTGCPRFSQSVYFKLRFKLVVKALSFFHLSYFNELGSLCTIHKGTCVGGKALLKLCQSLNQNLAPAFSAIHIPMQSLLSSALISRAKKINVLRTRFSWQNLTTIQLR